MYKRRRSGLNIVGDTAGIKSDCHQISFENNGDVDAWITVNDQTFLHKIGPYMLISFGDDSHPEIVESNVFNVKFDPAGVGNKSVSIQIMNLIEVVETKCDN
jgi:hypothetical protein